MRLSITPCSKKVANNVGHISPSPKIIWREMWMSSIQGLFPWNGYLNNSGASVTRQQFNTLLTKECICDVLIKLRSISKVVVKSTNQTRSGQSEMDLILAASAHPITSMRHDLCIESLRYTLPAWVRG